MGLFHDTRLLSSSRKRKEKHVLLHAPDLCTAGCICCCAMHQSTYSHSDQGFFNSISLPMFPDSSRADWNENQGHGFSIASNAKLLQMQSIASFLYRPFLQMPWESKHWSANRGPH